jgi:tetratricopeptide (TPR) repeat protein
VSQSDFVTRGQALVSSGQYQEAVKVCRLGLLGRPTTVEGRVVLGQALLALKRYDEVLAEMRVALELDHTSQAAHVLKGEAQLRKGDGHGAVETLGALRSAGLADAHVGSLLAEAERMASRSPPGNANPSVGFLAQEAATFTAEAGTKNYPAHQLDDAATGFEPGASEYTRPTSLAAPGPRKRSPELPPDATPSPAVLAVGDRSGTVEVDPDADGLALRVAEEDLGDAVGPPTARGHRPLDPFDLDAAATGVVGRGAVSRSKKSAKSSPKSPAAPTAGAKKSRRAAMFKEEVSTVELGDDEVIELDEPRTIPARPEGRTARKLPGPGTAVRNAVKLPSGPIDQSPMRQTGAGMGAPPLRPTGPSMPAQPPPHLAQMIANQPHVMNVMPAAPPPPPQPTLPHHPPPPQPPLNPRSAIAAALPTAAALPMPSPVHAMPMGAPMAMGQGMQPPVAMPAMPPGGPPMGMPPPHLAQTMLAPPNPYAPAPHPSAAAAARPTIALNAQQQHSAAVVDSLFNGQDGQGGWGRPMASGSPPYGAARPGADDSGRQPQELDSQLLAMSAGGGSGGVPVVGYAGEASAALSKSARSGRRRSRMPILVWVLISVTVISSGVFAGFQIRAMRLRRQIAAARDGAASLARADTWQGWVGARDGLYSIALASPTADNKAALAHARGVLAFEFGDGLADAKNLVDALGGQGGQELDLATAYLALAQRDAKLARDVADRAAQDAPSDAAALYVSGQAALLTGDLKSAIAALRSAVERDPRPHHLVGLARALGEGTAWDEAFAAVDRARDNPGAVIARAVLLAGAGRASGASGSELRAQLVKLIADGGKPTEQAASPAQVALADLALARVDHARGDTSAAHADYLASLGLGLDDQRFAEELSDTVLAIGEIEAARKVAMRTVERWPTSRRARLALAQIWLALGKPAAALELFTKSPDLAAWPAGQTVRGQARYATGDVDGARADFDTAIKKLAGYEPAMIARTWLDLAAGDVDAARKRIEPKFNPKTATPGMAAAYAAILRATNEPDARDKAKALLERVVAGGLGPDIARAQLELARIDRDLGDGNGARTAYAEASRAGNFEARLESGVLLVETGDPRGGRETLEQLLKQAGDQAPAALLIETARARTLMGDHRRAFDLLAVADKTPGVVRWQVDRERGRIALRKGDFTGAAQSLGRALDGCGGDLDSFVLAADAISADDKLTELAVKLKALMPARLKGRPELDIIAGKLALAANQFDEALKHYTAAREALIRDNALPRRLAQCDFGLGATAYFRHEDAEATSRLKLVTGYEDPSIDAAYLFAAELDRGKDPDKALATAQQAVAYNPDSVDGWKMVGTIAAQLPRQRRLLDEAINRVGDLAPGSDALHQLQRLR